MKSNVVKRARAEMANEKMLESFTDAQKEIYDKLLSSRAMSRRQLIEYVGAIEFITAEAHFANECARMKEELLESEEYYREIGDDLEKERREFAEYNFDAAKKEFDEMIADNLIAEHNGNYYFVPVRF
jgi:hypothetical protein